MSNDPKHPELHVYEEERNDLIDVALGFGVFFGVLFLIAIVATVITLVAK
ncbi:YqzM family protein [Paenibacillus validus]|uniref:YqzM family protein n=1 Tax=Paenibacillus validus TaxID=44253 RepID=A0A7X2ZBG9_9BACL|nr:MULTISPECIES: YqzM family protein [Paenibacillus]MED4603601.1 YqzM family protein [Paenibacillus validus]MED4609264.1 YqzM family protein [Paenibacillus validus]MUG71071.1 YqzM family protein [Paenibacillus validus]